MPIIKASSITNLADARYFASYGAALMGFCFNPQSSNYVNPYKMQEISGWLHGPAFVGEFENISVDAIIETIKSLNLQYAQIKLEQISKEYAAINVVPLIIEVSVNNASNLIEIEHQLSVIYKLNDYILIDLSHLTFEEISSKHFHEWIKTVCNKFASIIAYLFSYKNVLYFTENFNPNGIALEGNKSKSRNAPVNNFEDLDQLISLISSE